MKIRVAIIEDDEGLRDALAALFRYDPRFEWAGAFSTAEAALKSILRIHPDVLLVDLHLPGLGGIEAIRQMQELSPSTQCLVLTVNDDPETVFEALRAGAGGYIVKRQSLDRVMAAIIELREGGAPMSAPIARLVLREFARRPTPRGDCKRRDLPGLTPRELEVLELTARGDTDKEIGVALKISTETVDTHLRRIYKKLQVRNRTAAAAKYFEAERA